MSLTIKAKKIISINQPAYLPWLGYFERISNSDYHVVLDHVQFEKNSMINRNKIQTANGSLILTVPIQTSGGFGQLTINNLTISEQKKWQKKHWQSIYFSYKKAPFFEKYHDELALFYQQPWLKLNDLLKAQLRFFVKALGINTTISFSSEVNWQRTKSDLVLEICQKYDADHYISGTLGRNYLNLDTFVQANVSVEYQDYKHPYYQQFKEEFSSHLSVLDLLLHHGDKSLKILRNSP
jgi:hypothetical protein